MNNINDLVQAHFILKSKLAAKEADYKASIKVLEEARDKIKGMLVEALDEMGVENVKTESGTPYFSHPETYKVVDPETFIQWVVDRGVYEVLPETLTRKEALRAACADDGVPPGVEATTIRQLCVRKN